MSRQRLLISAFLFVSLTSLSISTFAQETVAWSTLPKAEQEVLAPIEGQWKTLSEKQHQRLRHLAQRYPTLPPEKQARVRQRLANWTTLPPEARQHARERYQQINKMMPPEKKHEHWQTYKQLSNEEKHDVPAAPQR